MIFVKKILKVIAVIFGLVITTFSQTAQSPAKTIVSSYEEKEVRFANNGINLAATLLIPKGIESSPCVVIVHGSGSSDRSNPWTAAYAKALAQHGIAVLYPDKRGSGKSEGNWRTSSFTDLADDTIAAVEFVRNQPKIDKERVGIIGFSQGGDVVPVAASRSSHIAFAIDISGSTVPILEQITDELVMGAEHENLTEKQISILKDINSKGIDYAVAGKGWNEYMSALNVAKNGELKGQKILEDFPTDPMFASFIRTIGAFDPIPYWKKLTIPVLFVYGGQDTKVRVHKSIQRIEETLSPNKRNYSVMLFNSNGHPLFRDDLTAFILQWIADRGAS